MRNISLVLGALVLSLPNLSQAKEKHYPCNGAPGEFRLNPDSSQGGFVAFTATVDSSVVIDLEASVCNNKNETSLNGSDVYWIYVTVGDIKTGQCLQHEAKVKVSDNKLSFM